MKAAVYHGPHNIRIQDVPDAEVKAGQVKVDFAGGNICGTDMHFWRGDWRWMRKGMIIGHDAFGIRSDTGERVVMVPVVNCGHCKFCLSGHPTYCVNGKFYGLTRDGFFAQSKAMPIRSLIPVPDDVSDDEAAVLEPVTLALRVINSLNPQLGDWVTVLGQGAVGLLMTQVAKLKGCKVIAVDLEDYRLDYAKRWGADEVINAKTQDVPKTVRKLTKYGSDFVVEAAGTQTAVEQTPFLARKTGKVVLAGEPKGFLDLTDADEVQFQTMYISPVEYPQAVQLIAEKKVNVAGLITHHFTLWDIEKAFAAIEDPKEKALKVVLSR